MVNSSSGGDAAGGGARLRERLSRAFSSGCGCCGGYREIFV